MTYAKSVRAILLLFVVAVSAAEYPFRGYVADIDAESITLAWGRADGTARNSIGRGAAGNGNAVVRIDGRTLTIGAGWLRVAGLKPDTAYPYTVQVEGQGTVSGVARTWPAKATSLTFFVIGDFGTGEKVQYRLAARMEEERQRLEKSNRPVRFVLSVGDNIYGKLWASGAQDRDWEKKFFAPYAETLRAIPFKAILGNHDGNESEKTADLGVCLDNFFLPDRWYRFTYASFVEFIALDTTSNQQAGKAAPVYLADGAQSKWLGEVLAKPPLPWRLVAMHHPMFTAGPNHEPFLERGRHWFEAMRRANVEVVFSGHEHNLQFSERNEATGGMQFVVSGAGGELRPTKVQSEMAKAQIAAWSNQNHFLVVTITDREMTMEAVGYDPIRMQDAAGIVASKPIRFVSKR